MSDFSEKEVLEYVAALQMETQTAREDALHYEQVFNMYHLPKLAPDLLREEALYVLSPDPIHEVREIKAQVLGFDTEIECLATRRSGADTITLPDQNAVDQLEKSAAVFLTRLDPDLYTYARIIHDQCIKPLAIAVLECTGISDPDPAKRFPWKLYDVTLDGCGWLEERGEPTVAGRQYVQYDFKIAETYSGRRDGPEGPAQLYMRDNGRWDWQKASDDFTERTKFNVNSSDHFEPCHMVWLDDGTTIYHVAIDRPSDGWKIGPFRVGKSTKTTGKLVGKYPNTFGRVSMFLIPSHTTTGRATQDHYLPFYIDGLVTAEQENLIDSTRATAARNRAAPRDYWHPDPEFLKEYMNTHNGQLPPPTTWDDSKTPVGMGELKTRPVDIDPDIDKLDQKIQKRKDRYSNASSSVLRDPDVLKSSTAAAQLAAYDSDNVSKSTLIHPLDVFRRSLLEAWEHSVIWLGDPKNSNDAYDTGPAYSKFILQSDGGTAYVASKGPVASGAEFEITPKSFEVPHKWRVTTRQRSRGQSQAEFAAAVERMATLPDGRPNVGIYDDLMRAAGVSDTKERKATLAKESMLWESQPLVDQWLKDSIAFEIEAEDGIRVKLLGQSDQGINPPPGGGGELPPQGLTVNSPVTNPTEGGSGAAFQAG